MMNYFSQKTAKDFKNLKQYWKFYSSSINIKSANSSSKDNIILKDNDSSITNQKEVAEKFNEFFTTLVLAMTSASTKLITYIIKSKPIRCTLISILYILMKKL